MPWYDVVGAIFVLVIIFAIFAMVGSLAAEEAMRRIKRNRQYKIDDQLYAERHAAESNATHVKNLETEIYKTPLERLIDQAEADEAERFFLANEHLEPVPVKINDDSGEPTMEPPADISGIELMPGVTREHGRTYIIGPDGYPVDVTPLNEEGCECDQCQGWTD